MTGQNTSSAVMQQRQEARDALDDFATPPWATRALCEWLSKRYDLKTLDVREPCANRGYMVAPLAEYFSSVTASDVHDYGAGFPVNNYLFGAVPDQRHFTIMNPPFRLAQQFIERATDTSSHGVCVLVRTSFLEGAGRYGDLFKNAPPTHVLQFAERVVMHKGPPPDPNIPVPVWDKKKSKWVMRKPSTATSYCWLIWDFGDQAAQGFDRKTAFEWIAPCRKDLEHQGDYNPRGDHVD